MDMMIQGQELTKKPHIVVSTPGRLADHIESCKTFTLKTIKFLVMDEADRLLGGDFDEQLKIIFTDLPKKKQSLFFSATITDALEKLKGVTGNEVSLFFTNSSIDYLGFCRLFCPTGFVHSIFINYFTIKKCIHMESLPTSLKYNHNKLTSK